MKSVKEQKSYVALTSSAKTLFWKYGFGRVTVEEICKEAKISKMTFYRIFNNKNEIALQVLNDTLERNMQEYRTIMNQDIPFAERIKQVISLKFRETKDIGEEFIRDIYSKADSDLRNCIEKYKQTGTEEFLNDLLKAQKNNWIRQDIKPEFILYMMEDMYVKMMDERLIRMHANSQELIMELTNFFFYGISLKVEN